MSIGDSMKYLKCLVYWILLLGLLAVGAFPVHAAPASLGEVVSLSNEFVQVLVSPQGQFTIGSVGGDPLIAGDDNKVLVYGYDRGAWTSFTSVRVVSGGGPRDYLLRDGVTEPPLVSGDSVTIAWMLGDVRAQQVLTLANNPFTDRRDTVKIATSVTNVSSREVQAGVRVMIDTMIGGNDFAPFFVPETGNTSQEQEYGGGEIPVYWKAFEASDYNVGSLKGQGIILGQEATPPDRFILASWPRIGATFWDYAITPGMEVGDSAVALYWNPKALQPAESMTYVTYYGLAGVGGGKAWIDASQTVTSRQPEFQATLWVANNSDADFTGGRATLSLPAGLALAAGESMAKPLSRVPLSGGAQSVSWRLVASGDRDAEYPYSVNVAFESGSAPLSAEAAVRYQLVLTPTPTHPPTPTKTPLPTSTPTPSPTLMPTPTPTPLPFALFPLIPDTRWNWRPWLLLLLPLALLLLLLLRRPARRLPPPPPARPSRPCQPTAPGEPRNARPRPGGQDITPDRPSGRGLPGGGPPPPPPPQG